MVLEKEEKCEIYSFKHKFREGELSLHFEFDSVSLKPFPRNL